MTQSPSRPVLYAAIESLQRLTDLMQRRRQQLARGVGLSPQQWQVLEEISRDGFMPSLFARDRDSSPAGVSRTLRQLLDRRLVVVSISADDARKRDYALTRRGERVLADVRAAREKALEVVWRDLDARDVEAFAHFGSRLAERLGAYVADSQEAGPPR